MVSTEAPTAATALRSLMAALYEDIHNVSSSALGYFEYPIRLNIPTADNATPEQCQEASIREAAKVKSLSFSTVTRLARVYAINEKAHQNYSLSKKPPLPHAEAKQQLRHHQLAASDGYVILSILAFSSRFRDTATHLDDMKWAAFAGYILNNKRSLEFFAKSHHLPWLPALHYYDMAFGTTIPPEDIGESFIFVLLPNDHPHNWYLSLEGPPQRKKLKLVEQVNIDANVFNQENHANLDPPGVNPLTRRSEDGPCMLHDDYVTEMMLGQSGFPLILVELAEMPGKGIDIRTLASYKVRDRLGEYKGEIRDEGAPGEYIYRLFIDSDANWDDDQEHVGRGPVYEIDGLKYGTWTRHLNHSYNESSEFQLWREGARISNAVIVTKDVNIVNEMTINYGTDYFKTDISCLCGEDICEYSAKTKVKERATYLKEK